MTQKAYSGAYSRRRYSNLAAANTAGGGNGCNVTIASGEPSMGTVHVMVLTDTTSSAFSLATDHKETMRGSAAGYGVGTTIRITAEPFPGYRFVQWQTKNGNTNRNPLTVKLEGDYWATARFELANQVQTRTIKVHWDDTMGRVQANGMDQNGQISGVNQGDTITLNANPNDGYHFVKWVGGPQNGTQTTAHYTFQANGNYDIAAVFAADSNGSNGNSDDHKEDEPLTPGNNVNYTPVSATLMAKAKSFVKQWWWALIIVAYIVYRETKKGGKA